MRILLEGGDGSSGGKAHVAGGVEGLHVKGGVVVEGGVERGVQALFEVRGVLQAERVLSQGFEVGGEDFVESLERSVVEADHWTDGGARFVDLRLSVELGPSRVEVPHLGEEVRSDLLLVTEFLQDSVQLVGDGLSGVCR